MCEYLQGAEEELGAALPGRLLNHRRVGRWVRTGPASLQPTSLGLSHRPGSVIPLSQRAQRFLGLALLTFAHRVSPSKMLSPEKSHYSIAIGEERGAVGPRSIILPSQPRWVPEDTGLHPRLGDLVQRGVPLSLKQLPPPYTTLQTCG